MIEHFSFNFETLEMYLLQFYQADTVTNIGLFDSVANGRQFLQTIPGYVYSKSDHETELLDYKSLPDYLSCDYNGHRIVITKFMFKESEEIQIIWLPLINLDDPQSQLEENSFTRVDAYFIDSDNVESYIKRREQNYLNVKKSLEKMGYQVKRDYAGSEDGEAIVTKHPNTDEQWHFLTHMNPAFVDENFEDEKAILDWLNTYGIS